MPRPRGRLELTQPDVVEELRRAHDQIDDRPDEREEQHERRAHDEQWIVDPAPRVGERPEDQRQIEDAEHEEGNARLRVCSALFSMSSILKMASVVNV